MSQLHYVPHVTWGLLAPPQWDIRAELDGRTFCTGVHQLAVGNVHSYGGPMEMTPAAVPNDGLLDVMAARFHNVAEVANMMACGFLRALHLSSLVAYARGRRLQVSAGHPRVPYEVDGEAAGFLPLEVQLAAQPARVLAPAGFRPVRREPRPRRMT